MEKLWNGIHVFDDGSMTDLRGRPKNAGLNGLISVTLDNGLHSQFKRERIVYMAFSGEKIGGQSMIEFINGDTSDYRYENLRCISISEYREKTGFKKSSRFFSAKEVALIKEKWSDEKGRMSQKTFAKNEGISLTTFKKIIKGEYKCKPDV